jgi:hypothetical protein
LGVVHISAFDLVSLLASEVVDALLGFEVPLDIEPFALLVDPDESV